MIPSPDAGTYANRFNAVAALSSSDIWAVGYRYNGTIDVTLAEHWNGSTWHIVTSSNVGTNGNSFTAVAAVSAVDVWAAGYYQTGGSLYALTEHWDGTAWSVVPSLSPSMDYTILEAISAVSSGDVWAVGIYSSGAAYLTLVEHWDGSAWSIVAQPQRWHGQQPAQRGSGSIDRRCVGCGQYSNGTVYQTLVEHWNGSAWSVVPSPNLGSHENNLNGVAAISSNDVWAVGYWGGDGTVYQTLVEHWDGSAWSIVPSPNVSTYSSLFSSVAAVGATLHPGGASGDAHGTSRRSGADTVSSSDVWAVGYYNNGSIDQTLVEHWDGSAWVIVASPNVGTHDNLLSAVSAVSSSDVWAVGYYNNGSIDQTLAERYNPCPPTPTSTRTSTPTSTPTACTIQFSDVPPDSTFYAYIHCLACRGIVNGYPDGTFKPNNPVTRGQLSKIDANSAGYSETHTELTFQDVPSRLRPSTCSSRGLPPEVSSPATPVEAPTSHACRPPIYPTSGPTPT